MIFHNKQNVIIPDLKINGNVINRVNRTKFLGVLVDDRLEWRLKISAVCKNL